MKQYGGAGPRLMYPSTALSASLARCDALAQLLFDRLVTQADDQGRMVAVAEVVRGQCMPLVKEATVAKVARWLDQLEAQGMIQRYEASGHHLLQIENWWGYQQGMRRAYPSRWPAPPEWEDKVFGLPSTGRNGSAPPPASRPQSAGKVRAESAQAAGTVPADRGESPPVVGTVPLRAGAGAPPANRTEGTYVPGIEVSPLPPSPGGGESEGMHDEYLAFLAVLSEATGLPWREEALSRTQYLARRQEGFSALDLADAARGVALDPWWMGRNVEGIPRCNPTAVLKSQQLQTFIALARQQITPGTNRAGPGRLDALAGAMEAAGLKSPAEPLRLVEGTA